MPLTTGFLAGLGWGLLAALAEGLPLLLQGSPWPHLGSRLLALAYLAALYGALCALLGGVLGAVASIVLRLARRRVSRAGLFAAYAGLFAAVTLAILWLQRFDPGTPGLVFALVLSGLLGAGAGWLLYHAARGRAGLWPPFRAVVLATYLAALVAVLTVAGFRAYLVDLPLFNPAVTSQVATAEQPNIVLITASGVRPDHLGVYGYDPEISPSIDALARRGARFEQAIAQASWTEPSLASLLTSLYPSELGIHCRAAISCQPHLDAERRTLAEALQDQDYRTQAFLGHPWLTDELGFAQGFDGFETVRAEGPFDPGPVRNRTMGRLLGCRQDAAACRLMVKGYELLFEPAIPLDWGGDRINGRLTRFLELHGSERFFVWVHYAEALPPYNLEPPYRPMPEGELASRERRLRRLGYWELGDPFTPREELLPLDVQGLQALYDGEVHRVDRLVGGVTKLIDAFRLTDRTLVVFTADHGQEFLEHGGYTYGHSLYDEVLRVPLVLAGPGVQSPGQVVDTPVGLLDLAPTLAEVAGASLPPEVEGQSLLPALQGQALAERPVYSESLYRVPHELKALRQGDLKLIYHVDDDRFALYDLSVDPEEQVDLSTQDVSAAEAMATNLLEWMAHTRQVAEDLPRAAPPEEFPDAVW